MIPDIVAKIRANIVEMKGSEVKAIATSDSLKSMWNHKQTLLAEMNAAKKLAAEEAAKPYLDLIAEVDLEYAFLLQMIGDNGGNN